MASVGCGSQAKFFKRLNLAYLGQISVFNWDTSVCELSSLHGSLWFSGSVTSLVIRKGVWQSLGNKLPGSAVGDQQVISTFFPPPNFSPKKYFHNVESVGFFLFIPFEI